jgi:SAM-dependent methyltransferase
VNGEAGQEESVGSFDAETYWEERLSGRSNLRGTGHRQFSVAYNEVIYRLAAERLHSALVEAGVDLAGSNVLDVGAGFGYFVRRYLEWGASSVTGVDITQTSVQFLRQAFPHLVFLKSDISAPAPSIPGSYDLVSAISVIFHIVDDRRFDQALENMCIRVNPGGHLVVVDSFASLVLPSARHARLRGFRCYQRILKRHDFQVLTVRPMYYIVGRTLIPVLGPRLLSWRPLLNLLLRFERALDGRLRWNLGGLKFLVARRSGSLLHPVSPD